MARPKMPVPTQSWIKPDDKERRGEQIAQAAARPAGIAAPKPMTNGAGAHRGADLDINT